MGTNKIIAKRISYGKLSKIYHVADTLDGELEALKAFQDEYADVLPKLLPGKLFRAYFGKFKIVNVGKDDGR
jgi:hypothetical protein